MLPKNSAVEAHCARNFKIFWLILWRMLKCWRVKNGQNIVRQECFLNLKQKRCLIQDMRAILSEGLDSGSEMHGKTKT